MAKQGEAYYRYSYRKPSASYLQILLLLETVMPLDEGFSVVAEGMADKREEDTLLYMAEGMELRDPSFKVLEDTRVSPDYVVKMAKLGQQTGTMNQMMQPLSRHYDKEYRLIQAIKNTVAYPIMMVVTLLVVLFALFSWVMPAFNKAYEQLGAQMSPVTVSAIRLGGVFSGGTLVVSTLLVVFIGDIWLAFRFGKRFGFVERFISYVKRRDKIILTMINRRFIAVLVLILKGGMKLGEGMELARGLVANQTVAERIGKCSERLQAGEGYYRSTKDTGLFSGSYIQMIKVGSRSDYLDQVMEGVSGDYGEMADTAIDNMIARFELTIAAVLAMSVGLVLLFAMSPLVGAPSAIGQEAGS